MRFASFAGFALPVFITALLLIGFPVRPLPAEQGNVHAGIYEDLRVQTFVGVGAQAHEMRDKDVYERTRGLNVQGEWAPASWISVYLRVPYTEMVHTDRDRVLYWDHVRGGLKLQFGTGTVGFLGGIFGDAARGHNKAGDVPSNYGYLEPYAGAYLDLERFYLMGAARWNTETTSRMIEQPGENFRRTWLFDTSAGLRLNPITLLLDARYHDTYDPSNMEKRYLEVGPGIDWHIGSGFHCTLAAIYYTASESKNRGAVFTFRKFID